MSMTNEEYAEVLHHFLDLLEEYDPIGREQLMLQLARGPDQPRELLLNTIGLYRESGSYRTVDTHARALALLNAYVHTEGGNPIQSIQVSLTPTEQRLYGRESLQLTPSTDYGEFVAALGELYELILVEEGDSDGEGRDQG